MQKIKKRSLSQYEKLRQKQQHCGAEGPALRCAQESLIPAPSLPLITSVTQSLQVSLISSPENYEKKPSQFWPSSLPFQVLPLLLPFLLKDISNLPTIYAPSIVLGAGHIGEGIRHGPCSWRINKQWGKYIVNKKLRPGRIFRTEWESICKGPEIGRCMDSFKMQDLE